MSSSEDDGILELILQAESEEQFLRELDTERGRHELFSALEGEGRMYELENNYDFQELDTLFVGLSRKLYEYVHKDPPGKRPQEIRH